MQDKLLVTTRTIDDLNATLLQTLYQKNTKVLELEQKIQELEAKLNESVDNNIKTDE